MTRDPARALINREIQIAGDTIKAKSLINPQAVPYDPAGVKSLVYIGSFHVGSNNVVRDVVVKSVNGSRRYAQQGQAVTLIRSTKGRWICVGPAERFPETTEVKLLDLDAAPGSQVTTEPDEGFSTVVENFDFYQGDMITSRWNNGTDAFPKVRIVNAQGTDVPVI